MEAQSALTRSPLAGDEDEHMMGSLVRELTNDFLADHTFWTRKSLKDSMAVARLDSRTTKVVSRTLRSGLRASACFTVRWSTRRRW